MTLYTVTIAPAAAVEVYGGLDACDAFLSYSSSPGAETFRGLTSDERKRRLVDATRYIDRERWRGSANAAGGTVLAFPRDGLLTVEGAPASNEYQLARVSVAAFEMAAVLATDADAGTQVDQSSNIKRLKAEGAELEFFSPTRTSDGTATTLPPVVQSLLGMWLAGGSTSSVASAAIGGVATGTRSDSYFDACDGYRRGEPF